MKMSKTENKGMANTQRSHNVCIVQFVSKGVFIIIRRNDRVGRQAALQFRAI